VAFLRYVNEATDDRSAFDLARAERKRTVSRLEAGGDVPSGRRRRLGIGLPREAQQHAADDDDRED
jgi:hypothetical protein